MPAPAKDPDPVNPAAVKATAAVIVGAVEGLTLEEATAVARAAATEAVTRLRHRAVLDVLRAHRGLVPTGVVLDELKAAHPGVFSSSLLSVTLTELLDGRAVDRVADMKSGGSRALWRAR